MHRQSAAGASGPPVGSRFSDEKGSALEAGDELRLSPKAAADGLGRHSPLERPADSHHGSGSGRRSGRGFWKSELAAGTCYCCMSTAMVLLNKHALSSFHFECPNSLLLFQCALACALVKGSEMLGLLGPLEKLSWRIVRVWLPANILFVAMIWTSFCALKNLNVAMVTVLKNLTNLVTIVGDYVVNGKRYPPGVWLTLALMLVSALAGASTDLTFSLKGYLWQIGNCIATASYSLYLRVVMDKVQVLSSKTGGFDEFSMVWYNNILSLPLVIVLVVAFGEHQTLREQPALQDWGFRVAAAGSGLVGFAISFCSLWFLSTTTATTYSLTGSLNKIPIALIGLFWFDAKPSWNNAVSVLIGLAAGVVFGYVKARQAKRQSAVLPVTMPRPGDEEEEAHKK